MPRLRTTSPDQPGWTRRRSGKGFVFLDEDGRRLLIEEAQRVKDLVIPPAWRDVWVTPYPNGHLQAVGTDVRGRRQYLYHPVWREKRDRAKHERVLQIARHLPAGRLAVATHLRSEGMTFERALATAFRLLDLGYFRVGSDSYTDENGSFGLTTIGRQHVRRVGRLLVFEFVAKSGVEQRIEVSDPDVSAAIEQMRRRRDRIETLLAYQKMRRWTRIDAADVNAYLRDLLGDEVSAKDFRTWHGTVHAAVALARRPASSASKRKRAVAAAMRDVAEHLGNTPTAARASYVDPRLIDLYQGGATIERTVQRLERSRASVAEQQEVLERAVLRLLRT